MIFLLSSTVNQLSDPFILAMSIIGFAADNLSFRALIALLVSPVVLSLACYFYAMPNSIKVLLSFQ
jgi:hypothetical protein